MSGPFPRYVAAVHATPAFLDCDTIVEKACRLFMDAAGTGARLVAETSVSATCESTTPTSQAVFAVLS